MDYIVCNSPVEAFYKMWKGSMVILAVHHVGTQECRYLQNRMPFPDIDALFRI